MTTIAIDLKDDLQKVIDALDYGQAQTDLVVARLLTELKAAADKRVIVLDVGALGEGDQPPNPDGLRDDASNVLRTYSSRILRAVADALDSLTPPRPPEPTGLGAVVRVGRDSRYVRLGWGNAPWSNETGSRQHWDNFAGEPIEVLSEGVTS